MIYRLNDGQRDELLKKAEHGMGYQFAEDRSRVFLNAEIAINLHGEAIAEEDFGRLTNLLQEGADYQAMRERLPEYDCGLELATHGSYLSQTVHGEAFWRYSAFLNDRRIKSDGSVPEGTYATTANDSRLVTSGLGAVGRYALPNPMPARYAYVLQPPSGQEIRCGNSAPNFGQAGGGVEILFTQGLPPNSVVGPLLIPER